MKLDRVTITGADNSIKAAELAKLSADFPFVEWGILCSKTQMGGTRFPDRKWLDSLYETYCLTPWMKLSCHLCGRWVRNFLKDGDISFVDEIGADLFKTFQRVQLNFHGEPHSLNTEKFCKAVYSLSSHKQWIFQFDEVNNNFLTTILAHEIDGVPLFDTSGGAGILPQSWPQPITNPASIKETLYCGYAGGLGPDCIAEQLPKITDAAGNARIWIDMERKVRSEDDLQFDLVKVRKCLEITTPYIKSN